MLNICSQEQLAWMGEDIMKKLYALIWECQNCGKKYKDNGTGSRFLNFGWVGLCTCGEMIGTEGHRGKIKLGKVYYIRKREFTWWKPNTWFAPWVFQGYCGDLNELERERRRILSGRP